MTLAGLDYCSLPLGNADAYKRWIAFSLIGTHNGLHDINDPIAWLFDDESIEVIRHFTLLNHELSPYLFATAHAVRDHGTPAIRTMLMEFPDDLTCRSLDSQYMLGDSLLVAPVLRQDDIAEYYLPAGRWTNLLTGRVVDGGAWHREKQTFFELPLMVRENTLLPMSENDQSPHWTPDDTLTLHLFEPLPGARLTTNVTGGDGTTSHFTLTMKGNSLTLEGDTMATEICLCLHNRRVIGEITNGQSCGEAAEGEWVAWDDSNRPLELKLAR